MKRDINASGEATKPMPDSERPRKRSRERPKNESAAFKVPKIEVPKVSKQALSELLLGLDHAGQRLDRRLRLVSASSDAGGSAAFRRRFRFFAADVLHGQTAILAAVAALLQVQINVKEAFNED